MISDYKERKNASKYKHDIFKNKPEL